MQIAGQRSVADGIVRMPAPITDSSDSASLDESWLLDTLNDIVKDGKIGSLRLSMLCIELEGFREVQSTLGRRAASRLLRTATERINCAVAETDLVATALAPRFTIALRSAQSHPEIVALVERIIEFLRQPFPIDGIEVFINANVGIGAAGDDARSPQDLLDNADMALAAAKYLGRDRYVFHTAEMISEAAKKLHLHNDLHHALANDELTLVYQPIVDRATRRVVALEALLRWQHPELGLLMPSSFIELAEESGFIIRLGEWVIEQAIEQGCRWDQMGLPAVQINVNVSPRQFNDPELHTKVKRILRRTGFPGARLQAEVTETAMHDVEVALRQLRSLDELGVGVAIDDFGTGYTSLALLKRFPIDVIKIDRSFVTNIKNSRPDSAIVRAICNIALSLGAKTVVEGVETAEQAECVAAIGVDRLQGFYFGYPVSVAQCTEAIRTGYAFGEGSPSGPPRPTSLVEKRLKTL